VQQLGHGLGLLVFQQDAAASQGLRDRPGVVGQDGDAERHGLEQRDAEPFVLGEAEEDVGHRVARQELVVVHVTGEDHLVQAKLAGHLLEPVVVPLVASVVADQEQAAARLQVPLVDREGSDQVVDPLVGNDAPHEEDVDPAVVVEPANDRRGRTSVGLEVQDDGQDCGPPEARRLQLAPVELAVPQAQLGARREGSQLASAVVAEAGEVRVEAKEEVRGRDVVVDADQAVRRTVHEAARGAPYREVEEADGLRRGDLAVLPERPGQAGHAWVHALCEDVGREARPAQVPLDGQGLVADGVAVGERGQDLVDPSGAGTGHAVRVPAIFSRKESVRRSTMSQSYSRAT
jgi:hypothetical protein